MKPSHSFLIISTLQNWCLFAYIGSQGHWSKDNHWFIHLFVTHVKIVRNFRTLWKEFIMTAEIFHQIWKSVWLFVLDNLQNHLQPRALQSIESGPAQKFSPHHSASIVTCIMRYSLWFGPLLQQNQLRHLPRFQELTIVDALSIPCAEPPNQHC